MTGRVRYTTFSKDPETMASQLAANARDTNDALASKISGFFHTMRYAATGTDAKIKLGSVTRPAKAAVLVNAVSVRSPGSPSLAASRLLTTYEDGSAVVLEPMGLTPGETYELTFLVLE